MKLILSDGMDYGIDNQGNKICRGAMMGRHNILPLDKMLPIKLRMEKLQMVYYDYDTKGAYWGHTPGTAIYCAHSTSKVMIFVRATSRIDAKNQVKEKLPNATFFR
jgi:hypothetical protein